MIGGKQCIVASYDHSVVAEAVLERALDWAAEQERETELYVLEVLKPSARHPVAEYGDREAQRHLARLWLDSSVLDQKWKWASHSGTRAEAPHLRIRFGSPVDEIAKFSEEVHADLVVVGRHRRPSLRLGRSTAQRLVSRLSCPVLVVQSADEREELGFDWVACSISRELRRKRTERRMKKRGSHEGSD